MNATQKRNTTAAGYLPAIVLVVFKEYYNLQKTKKLLPCKSATADHFLQVGTA